MNLIVLILYVSAHQLYLEFGILLRRYNILLFCIHLIH